MTNSSKKIPKKKDSKATIKRKAKEEIFCQRFTTHFNGFKAAYEAKYAKKSAATTASNLLKKQHIIDRIAELSKQTVDNLELTRDQVTREIAKIGFSNIKNFVDDDGNVKPIGKLDDDHAAVIGSIEVDSIFDKRGIAQGNTKKMKLHDKLKALQLLDNMFKEDDDGGVLGEKPDDKFL